MRIVPLPRASGMMSFMRLMERMNVDLRKRNGPTSAGICAAGRTNQRGDFARRNVERDAVQDFRGAVEEIEIADGDFRIVVRRRHARRRGFRFRFENESDHELFILSRRRTARRARIESARIIITSRNAPAHAWRCQSSYGEIAYVKTCTVSDAIGCVRLVDQKRLLNAVKRSGAVSPATRASATRMPVRMPGSAAGTMTLKTARPRVAPRASAPSRRPPGTRRSNSSVVRTTIGIISSPSATPPAMALKRFTGSTTMPYAKMPTTIDGTPLSTSAAKRTTDENFVPGYSERWMPQRQPTGTANAAAIPMRISVPAMALAMPPPLSPTGFGIFVKKSKFSAPNPSLTT